jgi:hypothetical protein
MIFPNFGQIPHLKFEIEIGCPANPFNLKFQISNLKFNGSTQTNSGIPLYQKARSRQAEDLFCKIYARHQQVVDPVVPCCTDHHRDQAVIEEIAVIAEIRLLLKK